MASCSSRRTLQQGGHVVFDENGAVKTNANPLDNNEPSGNINLGNESSNVSQSTIRAEERRRKILEKSETRLQRILGRPSDSPVENFPERHSCMTSTYVPGRSRRALKAASTNECLSEDFVSGPDGIYVSTVPYPLILFLSVLSVKLIETVGLEKYFGLQELSYIFPFFVIEFCFVMLNVVKALKGQGHKPFTHLKDLSLFEIFIQCFIFPLTVLLWHFAVYFVTLCLTELFLNVLYSLRHILDQIE